MKLAITRIFILLDLIIASISVNINIYILGESDPV
jgi:hypothetical protein